VNPELSVSQIIARQLGFQVSGPDAQAIPGGKIMPFVEIFVAETRPAEQRRGLADAVHRALVETVDVPKDDRFQAIHVHAKNDLIYDPHYLGISRTPEFVAIRITLRAGRSLEKKQALYRAIVNRAHDAIGIRPEDVLIVLCENQALDWSFGAGVAQYAVAATKPEAR
jgi:phenylpyruvate tautomerase PptA (4-oxalocrotonate tautomerase family)